MLAAAAAAATVEEGWEGRGGREQKNGRAMQSLIRAHLPAHIVPAADKPPIVATETHAITLAAAAAAAFRRPFHRHKSRLTHRDSLFVFCLRRHVDTKATQAGGGGGGWRPGRRGRGQALTKGNIIRCSERLVYTDVKPQFPDHPHVSSI